MKSISDTKEEHICELEDWPENLTQNVMPVDKEENMQGKSWESLGKQTQQFQ